MSPSIFLGSHTILSRWFNVLNLVKHVYVILSDRIICFDLNSIIIRFGFLLFRVVGLVLIFGYVPAVKAACLVDGTTVFDPDEYYFPGQRLVCDDIDLEAGVHVIPSPDGENSLTVIMGDRELGGDGAADTSVKSDGYGIRVYDHTSVTINSDTAIEADGHGIVVVGENNAISFGGQIKAGGIGISLPSSGGDGLFSNDNDLVMRGGVIEANSDGITVNGNGNTITINAGSIVSERSGIGSLGAGNIITLNGGSIDAKEAGIYALGDDTHIMITAGEIKGDIEAVYLDAGADESNSLTLGTEAEISGGLVAAGDGRTDLNLNGVGAGEFSDDISGFDTVRKVEDGTWVLQGTLAEVEIVEIDAGTLIINGEVTGAGSLTVNRGGRLGGTGTLGETRVEDGGTLAPGNSIGTLNVAGDLTLASGSMLEVEVDPAGASDMVNVSGQAQISGATVHMTAEDTVTDGTGYNWRTSYSILSADGGIEGEFADITDDFAFLNAFLTYGDTNIDLLLERNDIAFADLALTRNQKATAQGIDSLRGSIENKVYDAVVSLAEGSEPGVFDELSGEIHASAKGLLLAESAFLRGTLSDHIQVVTRPEPSFIVRPVAEGPNRSFWAKGLGLFGDFEADGNAAALTYTGTGFLAGLNTVAGDWMLGGATGYTRSLLSVKNRASSATVDSIHSAAYGGRRIGGFSVGGGLSYSVHVIGTERYVSFAPLASKLTASYYSSTLSSFGEVSFALPTAYGTLEPFGSLRHASHYTHGFLEKGGPASLVGEASRASQSAATLGIRAAKTVNTENGQVQLSGKFGWEVELGANGPPLSSHSFGTGTSFTVAGPSVKANTILLQSGVDFNLSDVATAGFYYKGVINRDQTHNALNARLKVMF